MSAARQLRLERGRRPAVPDRVGAIGRLPEVVAVRRPYVDRLRPAASPGPALDLAVDSVPTRVARRMTALDWAARLVEENGRELAESFLNAARQGDWRA